MSIEGDSKHLNMELRVLIDSLESEREKFTAMMPNQIKALEAKTKNLYDTNVMLQSIPQKMEDKLKSYIPQISAKLDSINESKLKNLEEEYFKTAEKHAALFASSKTELDQLAKKLDSMNARKIKRFFLGVALTVCISVFVSVSAAYFMMRSFPVRVVVNHPENIILNESQVSLWGTDNVKVLKNTKK